MTLVDESPQQRAERYMRQATELAKLAVKSSDKGIAETYLEMARAWLKLAEEVRLNPANDDREAEDDGDNALRG